MAGSCVPLLFDKARDAWQITSFATVKRSLHLPLTQHIGSRRERRSHTQQWESEREPREIFILSEQM